MIISFLQKIAEKGNQDHAGKNGNKKVAAENSDGKNGN